jgi:hypothetical protein
MLIGYALRNTAKYTPPDAGSEAGVIATKKSEYTPFMPLICTESLVAPVPLSCAEKPTVLLVVIVTALPNNWIPDGPKAVPRTAP